MVRSDYEKVFNEKGVFEESFMLKTFANFAGNANGLAVTLTGAAADAKLEFSVRKPGAETFEAADFERDGKVPHSRCRIVDDGGRGGAKGREIKVQRGRDQAKDHLQREAGDGLRVISRSSVAMPYAMARTEPMSGQMSMAPTMAISESISRPMLAINMAMIKMHKCEPVRHHPFTKRLRIT